MLIINPNPCFDRTLNLPSFSRGAIMRGDSAKVTAGGKGINVSRVIRAFDVNATLAVLVGALDSTRYEELLEAEGAKFITVNHSGVVRVATIIFEADNASTTIINEKGSRVDKGEWSRFVAKVAAHVHPGEIVACMGSFPVGIDESSIQELIDVVKIAEGIVILDSSPEFLKFAIAAGVDIVAPNLDEAEALIQGKQSDHFIDDLTNAQERAEKAAQELVHRGSKIAFVTSGPVGVAIATPSSLDFIQGVKVNLVSAVGAGDSFVAGVMLKYEEMRNSGEVIDWKLIAAFGVATASASCEEALSGGINVSRAKEIYEQILVSEVAI